VEQNFSKTHFDVSESAKKTFFCDVTKVEIFDKNCLTLLKENHKSPFKHICFGRSKSPVHKNSKWPKNSMWRCFAQKFMIFCSRTVERNVLFFGYTVLYFLYFSIVKNLFPVVIIQNGGSIQDGVEIAYIFHQMFSKMIICQFFSFFYFLWVKKLLRKFFFLKIQNDRKFNMKNDIFQKKIKRFYCSITAE
jgi:hypothetical protein